MIKQGDKVRIEKGLGEGLTGVVDDVFAGGWLSRLSIIVKLDTPIASATGGPAQEYVLKYTDEVVVI